MQAVILVSILQTAIGAYVLEEAYADEDFFSRFDFFHAQDPSRGYVEYVDYDTASSMGLVEAAPGHIFMGAASGGDYSRPRSVRLESTAVYNGGLFVATLDHFPTGCGTWPALWMYGEDPAHRWPAWGEYDIVEGEHRFTEAMTSLHTTAGCDQSAVEEGVEFTTEWLQGATKRADNCDVDAPGQFENQGCSQRGPQDSLGETFNDRGGGTYAAEWDPDAGHFRTWFWPTGEEPEDLRAKAPRPDFWGTPYSFFSLDPSTCGASHFKNMRIAFSLNFCGDLGSASWKDSCPSPAAQMSCEDYVGGHPEMMQDAYWSLSVLDVYQNNGLGDAPIIVLPAAESSREKHISFLGRVAGFMGMLRGFQVVPGQVAKFHALSPASMALVVAAAALAGMLALGAVLRRGALRSEVAPLPQASSRALYKEISEQPALTATAVEPHGADAESARTALVV